MVERLAGCDTPLLVHGQHPLQQVDEFPPVNLQEADTNDPYRKFVG
jgi:hypothetical protein